MKYRKALEKAWTWVWDPWTLCSIGKGFHRIFIHKYLRYVEMTAWIVNIRGTSNMMKDQPLSSFSIQEHSECWPWFESHHQSYLWLFKYFSSSISSFEFKVETSTMISSNRNIFINFSACTKVEWLFLLYLESNFSWQ